MTLNAGPETGTPARVAALSERAAGLVRAWACEFPDRLDLLVRAPADDVDVDGVAWVQDRIIEQLCAWVLRLGDELARNTDSTRQHVLEAIAELLDVERAAGT